jgi:hypothetical protein
MSIAEFISEGAQTGVVKPAPRAAGSSPYPLPAEYSFPPVGQRELRLDLFRGLALWLIFIDHVSPDLLSWFTIRSYGFSDATEIFIFISGYTAAFVYGRAMLQSGFIVGSARILRRVWQIYAMHILLFSIVVAEVSYIAVGLGKSFYADEMEVAYFLKDPATAMAQAIILRYRPLNMDVLPLYIVLMLFLPPILLLMKWRPTLTLGMSVLLYALTSRYNFHLTTAPNGFWSFNPFAWQMLFVFGAWCALSSGQHLARLLSSPITIWIAAGYLLAAFCVTLTWYLPDIDYVIPQQIKRWMYPIDKPDLDVLRLVHFMALAAITIRFVPARWPYLESRFLRPLILCGQHSLEIFSLSVFLAFTGYFVLTETSAGLFLHVLVGVSGIMTMTAVAWLLSWYKQFR